MRKWEIIDRQFQTEETINSEFFDGAAFDLSPSKQWSASVTGPWDPAVLILEIWEGDRPETNKIRDSGLGPELERKFRSRADPDWKRLPIKKITLLYKKFLKD